MSVYAVYDTNVIVSALLSRNANAATVKVLDAPNTPIVVTPAEMVSLLQQMDVLGS